jgi:hypothetical protein
MHQEGRAADTPTQSLTLLISGNTLVVVNRFGATLIHFKKNGLFRHFDQQDQASNGTWRATTDSICMTITTLPPGRTPKEYCMEMKGRSFGSSWEKEYPRNGTIKYKLLVGHPTFKQAEIDINLPYAPLQ